MDTTQSLLSSPEVPLQAADVSVPAADELADTAITAPHRAQWRVAGTDGEPAPHAMWPSLQQTALDNLGGAVAKFDANLAAIATLRHVECEDRPAYTAERGRLLRYTGWGSLPASFNRESDDKAWARRAAQLHGLLTDNEYESARASVNNSHYTPIHVIEAMWQAIERFGFIGGRILEPATGIGHFIGAMPRSVAENSQVTAIEIDCLSGQMLKALYAPGGVDVRVAPFEKSSLPDNWFDLVIGNVPFGKYKAGVDAEVAKLSTLFSVWRNQRYANESEIGRLPMMIEAQQRNVALCASYGQCRHDISRPSDTRRPDGRILIGIRPFSGFVQDLLRRIVHP